MATIILALLLAPTLPGTQPDGVACVLVRDARTGKPLAGVRVAQYLEDASDSFLSPELLAETTTDQYGIASIKWDGQPTDCHWVFDKPGFAVNAEYGHYPPDVVELEPGQTFTARVFGPFGKPRAGVTVEAILGCSHSPAVRRAVTNAEGRFTFRDIAPRRTRLWYVAPDLAAGYADATDGDIHALPGITLTGRVSVPNAVVGSQQEMRGPRVRAGADGVFRIPGFDRGEGIVACGPKGRVAYVDSDELDLAGPVQIVLRKRETGEIDGRPDFDADEVEVKVEIVDADTGKLVPDFDAWLRRADGWVFEFIEGTVKAPAGKYELRIGDVFSPHVAAPRPFEVKAGGTHRIRARRQAELVYAGEPPKGADLTLITPRAWSDHAAWLAPDVRAAVRVEVDGHVQVFPVGPAREGKRVVTFAWKPPPAVARPAPRKPTTVTVILPDGTRTEAESRDGVHLRVERKGLMPLYRRLKGDTVRWGRGTIKIEGDVKVVYIDGTLFDERETNGLDEGPHTIIAGGQVHRIVLAEGETRTLKMR